MRALQLLRKRGDSHPTSVSYPCCCLSSIRQFVHKSTLLRTNCEWRIFSFFFQLSTSYHIEFWDFFMRWSPSASYWSAFCRCRSYRVPRCAVFCFVCTVYPLVSPPASFLHTKSPSIFASSFVRCLCFFVFCWVNQIDRFSFFQLIPMILPFSPCIFS